MTDVGPVYLTQTHQYSFRQGESAVVLGVRMVDPGGVSLLRPCYVIHYAEGFVDYVPVDDGTFVLNMRAKDESA